MKLDIVLFNLPAGQIAGSAASILKVTKLSYEYPPLYIESGCNLVVPWSKHGHGSIGGRWLMFCMSAGNRSCIAAGRN